VGLKHSVNDEHEAQHLFDSFLARLPRSRAWLAAVTADDPLVRLDGSMDSLDSLGAWFERSLDSGTLPTPDAAAIYGTGNFGNPHLRRLMHDAATTGGYERRALTMDPRALLSAEAVAQAVGGYLAEVCRGVEPRLAWALNPQQPRYSHSGMPMLMGPSVVPLRPGTVLVPVGPLQCADRYVGVVLDGVRQSRRLQGYMTSDLMQYGVKSTFLKEQRTGPIQPYRPPWWARRNTTLTALVGIYRPRPPKPEPESWHDDLVEVIRMDEDGWSHEVIVDGEIAHDDDLVAAFGNHLGRLRRVRRVEHMDREVFLVHAPRLSAAALGAAAAAWAHDHVTYGPT
jgi:hypothetical protein